MTINKKQIYIVDDDASICHALKLLLKTFSFEVITFSSAEEFFKVVPNSAQGCLILDIHMPGLNGLETLKRVVKSGSKKKVIIMTADKSGGKREMSLKAGAVGFLQKPFDTQALVDLISKAF